jgi:hypothetical protein
VLAVFGVLAIAGAAILHKAFPAIALGLFVGGAVAAIAAAIPSYRLRGVVGAVGAFAVIASLVVGERSWALRAVAAVVLASALFTRASYRAHRGVRVAIGVGIALFLAAAASSLGAHMPSRVAAGVMALIGCASLLGFMGDQTTGGSALWGGLALLTAGASIAVVAPIALVPLVAIGTLVIATFAASLALYTVAASFIAQTERAREHRSSIPAPPTNHDD